MLNGSVRFLSIYLSVAFGRRGILRRSGTSRLPGTMPAASTRRGFAPSPVSPSRVSLQPSRLFWGRFCRGEKRTISISRTRNSIAQDIKAGHKPVAGFVDRVLGSVRLAKKVEDPALVEARFRLYTRRFLQLKALSLMSLSICQVLHDHCYSIPKVYVFSELLHLQTSAEFLSSSRDAADVAIFR